MSFTSDTKNELTKIKPENKCCQLAEISAFLRFSGIVDVDEDGPSVKLRTDNASVARHFIKLIKAYFGSRTALSVDMGSPLVKGRIYELTITREMNAELILRETGILGVKEGSNYITEGLSRDIVAKRCCRRSALKGALLSRGSISDPAKSYHMEIVCNSERTAVDIRRLMSGFGLKPKIVRRKGKSVVYIKEAEQIQDFLNIIGSTDQYFAFQDARILREAKGRTNRIANCESANMDKTVNASQRQLADIRMIEETRGLGYLSEKLRETAEMRKKYPELSLAELAELFDPPLKKSGLNNRFARLAAEAEKMREYRSEDFWL